MLKGVKSDLVGECSFQPLLSNSPLSSSWDFTARLLRLLKNFRASSSFMKIFFVGPVVKAGVSTHHTKSKERFSASHQSYVRPYGRTRLLSETRETLREKTRKWDDLTLKRYLHVFKLSLCTDSQERARNTASRARRAAYVRDIFGSRSELGGVWHR